MKKDTEQIIKSKERVQKYGEVYTPLWVVQKMIDSVDKSNETKNYKGVEFKYMENPAITVLEPTCGNGNFLHEIYRRRIEKIKQINADDEGKYQLLLLATKTIFGVDILADNVEESIERLSKLAYDFIKEISDNEADVVMRFGFVTLLLKNNIRQGNTLKIPDLPKWFDEDNLGADDPSLKEDTPFTDPALEKSRKNKLKRMGK